jgi:hypothetical protein
MLEASATVREVERVIADALAKVELLAELPLTEPDLKVIADLLRETIAEEGVVPATRTLRAQAPCALACLLVFEGVYGYKGGDFWHGVETAIGASLANVKTEWGHIFEEVLHRYELPRFADTGGHRYVTPILGHGGVPDYCLGDLFEKLLFPAVTGQLEYNGNAADLLDEWQTRSSLLQFTDKPVRRFLLHGGRAGQNFLERCLDMALEFEETGLVSDADELRLPRRVVDRFRSWCDNKPIASRSIGRRGVSAVRYRSPEIRLDLASAGLLLTLPRQTFAAELVRAGQPRVAVNCNNRNWAAAPLRVHRLNGTVDTEAVEIPLTTSFSNLQVLLTAAGQRVKDWTFLGITGDLPWMAFDARSCKLLVSRPLQEREFWVLSPQSWALDGDSVREEAPIWLNHVARKVELKKAPELRLTERSQGLSSAIQVDSAAQAQPRLENGDVLRWPRVVCAGHEVCTGALPDLIIPGLGTESTWERATLVVSHSMHDSRSQHRRTIRLSDLLDSYPLQNGMARIPLSDQRLLGGEPLGMFTVRLRRRLGHDATFRLCLLRGFALQLDPETLFPDATQGAQPVNLQVTVPKNVVCESQATSDSPTNLSRHAPGAVLEVSVPAHRTTVGLQLKIIGGTDSDMIPLEVSISRLEWALSGVEGSAELRYGGKPVDLTLQELEIADESRLFVRADLGRPITLTATLGEHQQTQALAIRSGRASLDLKPFLDSIRAANASGQGVKLRVEGDSWAPRTFDAVRIRAMWEVAHVQALAEVVQGNRRLYVSWTDRSRVRRRLLRLWRHNDRSNKGEVIDKQEVPENLNEAEFEVDLARMPDGRYRLEFAVADEWELPSFPDAYARNIQDLEIAGTDMGLVDSQARHLDDFLEAVECGLPVAEFFDPRIAKVLVSRPEVTQRLWEALYQRSRQDAPIDVLRQILTHADEDELALLEALAMGVVNVKDKGNFELAEWASSAIVQLGVMQRPWGSSLRELFSAPLFPSSGSRALPPLAEVYDQINWTTGCFARQFLKGLLKVSRIVRHQGLQVSFIHENHPNARENDLVVFRKAKAQPGVPRGIRLDNTSTAFVPVERWHSVRPDKETPKVICYVLAFFQRALAWGAGGCSENTFNAIDTLGKEVFLFDPVNYVRELLRADSEIQRSASSGRG